VDAQRVAVIGHSYGGYTALAAAGARIDTQSFIDLCQPAIGTDEPGAWLCEMLLPRASDMAALAGLDALPAGLWPAQADPRVDAVVSMTGDAFFFGQPGLAQVNVPVLAIGGTADMDSPYMWSTYPAYEYSSGPRKIRIALQDAEHMIFTGPCQRIPGYLQFFSGEFCVDSSWNRVQAQELTKHFTTAFLLAELNQDSEAARFLSQGNAGISGVDYEESGY
jgi:predicted dienelactone hydrolase